MHHSRLWHIHGQLHVQSWLFWSLLSWASASSKTRSMASWMKSVTCFSRSDNRISNQTTPLFQPCRHTKYEDAECSESRCLLPREAGLLWQQHPKPGAFVVPFADHLPLLISVANYPSQLVFKRLSICIENKSEQLEPLTACLLDHVLLHVYVPTLLLSVAAAKERCDEELLPWAEVLSLKADPLMPSLGLIMAMVEEGWWYHELLTAIGFGSAEKKGVGTSTMLKRVHL